MPAKVIVRDLLKRYGAVEAVRGVSFAVESGEIFGLLGPNAAGKTSTIECLLGLRDADGGHLEIAGFDVRRQLREAKQRIGAALQSTALQDTITPREALRLFGSFYRECANAEGLLARFGLTEKSDARYATLSGGQRQRLALALAFVNRPEVVLLDEPTTGLDPKSRRELHEAIAGMKSDGCTVLLSTHHLEEAERLCDRVAIIDRGRIVASGTPGELMAQARDAQTVTLRTRSALDPTRLAKLTGIEELRSDGGTWSFRTRTATATLAALTRMLEKQHVELIDLQVRSATLEDVFLALTREEEPPEPKRK